MTTPKVTVLLPVYNAASTIDRGIRSVLSQSFTDFEFLIINDGSTDTTSNLLSAYNDPRIRIIHQNNSGLVASLRVGVDLAKGEYIARIDADDYWANSKKLELQFEYLEQHPDCILVGTNYTVITPNKPPIVVLAPSNDQEIREKFLLEATFAHPSVMFRTDVCRQVGGYQDRFGKYIEDIDLWVRMGTCGKFHILPINGLEYFVSNSSITGQHATAQAWAVIRLIISSWRERQYFPSFDKALKKYLRQAILLSVYSVRTKILPS